MLRIDMSKLLYSFVEKNFRSEIEHFSMAEGTIRYLPNFSELVIQIEEEYYYDEFQSNVLTKVR